MSLSKPSDQVAVRDCQTQTLSRAELELALMQVAENANNHQREPEASVSRSEIEGKEDQTLPISTDTNKDRQEGEKPLNSTSAQGTGQIPGERQRKIEGQGKILPKSQSQSDREADLELAAENAYTHKKEPEASVTYVWKGNGDQPLKKVAKYAVGVAATGAAIGAGISVGIFVLVPYLVGLAVAGSVAAPVAGGAMVAAGAASAAFVGVSVGAASVGAAAGLAIGGAAAITGLYAAGEVTVGEVRYITRRKNRRPTKSADIQTDLDKSD